MFFLNPIIENQSLSLLQCFKDFNVFLDSALSQWVFEYDIFMAALKNNMRTYDSMYKIQIIPFLPFISANSGKCNGFDHKNRLTEFVQVVRKIPSKISVIMTCTCVMQEGLFRPYLNTLHEFKNIIQLTHQNRKYPRSVTNRVIVVPYYSRHRNHTNCSSNEVVFWRGSVNVANENATLIRRHIMKLHHHKFNFKASSRNVCKNSDEICINGMGQGRNSSMKEEMRDDMMLSQYCLIPEGDSPDSSRLYDAIQSLCIPVILSNRIPVMKTRVWRNTTIVLNPTQFLSMTSVDLISSLSKYEIGCKLRILLRSSTSAYKILQDLDKYVEYLYKQNKSVFMKVG